MIEAGQLSIDLLRDKPVEEHAAIVGRYALLQAMDYGFTEAKMQQLARGDMPEHRLFGGIKRVLHGLYGDAKLFDEAELELTAEQLGVFEDIPELMRGMEPLDDAA